MKHFAFTTSLFLIFAISAFSQTVKPTPPEPDENNVVKITTNLVQVDAVVIDKDGNPITNLTANDFEIWQDGKQQTITNLSYINRTTNTETSTQTIVATKKDKNAPPVPPASSRSTEFGRVLTFVVDDGNGCATQSGMIAAKEGLEKFVNEQMLPDDSVAIYQTREGSSLLQQYTSDKSRLLKIIQKIRWYPPKGIFVSCGNEPIGNNVNETQANKDQREALENASGDKQVAGLIGVTRYAINGLQRVSGRKILFLMSDSLRTSFGNREKQQISKSFTSINDLAVLANRTSVVINTIDVRGLNNPGMLEAADDVEGMARGGQQTLGDTLLSNRNRADSERRTGLAYLARETGGRFYENANFLDVPIKKVLTAQKGYYLIAYQPEEDTFKGKNFHKIEIKLKRPDLKSSSRSGFYGVTDEALRPKARTGDSELYDVLVSPLPNADMSIRLSSYFANTPTKGNFIHAILYIDGKDITFVEGANGNKKAVFDIVAVTLNEKNEVIDDSNSTRTVQIPLEKVREVQQNGLIYTVDVPVKKDGVYTFRTALREANTKRLGSSSQIIEVPDLKKGKLLVSGLNLSSVDANGKIIASEAGNVNGGFSSVISKSIPAIREFQRNSIVGYAYTIYNAKIDTTNNQPKLSIQTNLYRDGKLFTEGSPQNAQLEAQSDLSRINDYGLLRLNADVPTGDYVLQVIIKDLTTNQTTSQWIDFEVVE